MAEQYNQKDGNSVMYYILLREKTAEKGKSHSTSIRSATKRISLLKGEILFRSVHPVAVVHNGSMTLHPYNKPLYVTVCNKDEVQQIKEEQAKLLLPICTMVDRYNIYVNNLLENGRKMTISTNVYVTVNKQEFRGTIRYKGPLPDQDGTMFGVELTEGLGHGTTNGLFKAERYFHCQTDCGVFVSFEKLRLACEENSMLTKITSKLSEGLSNLVSGKQAHENSTKAVEKSMADKSRNNVSNHKEGDRVWVFIDDDTPHAGHIRFIGRPPGGKDILAGIELDHPVAQGNGEYYGKQLMNCEMNHAHFTLIENVISQEKLTEIWEKPNQVAPALKDKPSSSPQTSLDIVNMESNISKQSKADVIKEQEQLFKKIKQKGREQEDGHFGGNGIGPSLDLTDEKQSKLKNHVSRATLQMNTPRVSKGDPSLSSHMKNNLDIGSTVEVLTKNDNPRYGVIRWLGVIPDYGDKKIAGLEFEEEMTACSDGTFNGKRYFKCPSGRAFFVHLHNCTPDSRFNRNSIENAANKRLTGTVSRDEPSLPSPMENNLDIGSMVEVLTKNDNPRYGVIRWLGVIPDYGDKKIAGLELEEEMNICSDGTFHGIQYFKCPSRHAFFVHLHNCMPDSRFNRNSIESAANKRLTGTGIYPNQL